MTSAYFGGGFVCDNDVVPVIRSTPWIRGKQYKFCELVRQFGQPDFEYCATDIKSAYHFCKRNRKLIFIKCQNNLSTTYS